MVKKERGIGPLKRVWSEILPFVAQDPEMKLAWLMGTIKKKRLSLAEIAPYMRLLILDYKDAMTSVRPGNMTKTDFVDLFKDIDRDVMRIMIDSTDLQDVPSLLEFIPDLVLEDVVIILTKQPLPYEKSGKFLVDRVFHTVYERTSSSMLEDAAGHIIKSGASVEHFRTSYQRFKDIKEDEGILSALYPRAK